MGHIHSLFEIALIGHTYWFLLDLSSLHPVSPLQELYYRCLIRKVQEWCRPKFHDNPPMFILKQNESFCCRRSYGFDTFPNQNQQGWLVEVVCFSDWESYATPCWVRLHRLQWFLGVATSGNCFFGFEGLTWLVKIWIRTCQGWVLL